MTEAVQKLKGDVFGVMFASDHNLRVNGVKSTLIPFGPKRVAVSMKQIKVDVFGESVPVVNEARSLGLILDSDFRFKSLLKKGIL